MIIINDLKDKTINLGGLKDYDRNFEVHSCNDKGKTQPFQIELVTSEDILVEKFNVSSIHIFIDVEFIVKEEYIILKNILGEKLIITVKPNEYYTNDRNYKFKLTKNEFNKNGELKLKILSKVNNTEIGWRCIYDGKPIQYEITPMESDKSSYVTIKLNSILFIDYVSILKFQQNESGNVIEYKIKNTPNGMEKAG